MLPITSAEEVRAALAPLNLRQLGRLAELSGVPMHTIYKIKRGETANPGLETVRAILPHIEASQGMPQPDAHTTTPGALDEQAAA